MAVKSSIFKFSGALPHYSFRETDFFGKIKIFHSHSCTLGLLSWFISRAT